MEGEAVGSRPPLGGYVTYQKKKKTVSEISESGANLLSDQKEILLYKPKSYGLALVYYSFILIADNIMCDAFVHLDSDAFHKFQICNFIC